MTTDEVVAKYKVSRRTVYRWLQCGQVPKYTIGGRIRIDPYDVDQLIVKRERPMSCVAHPISPLSAGEIEKTEEILAGLPALIGDIPKEISWLLRQLAQASDGRLVMMGVIGIQNGVVTG